MSHSHSICPMQNLAINFHLGEILVVFQSSRKCSILIHFWIEDSFAIIDFLAIWYEDESHLFTAFYVEIAKLNHGVCEWANDFFPKIIEERWEKVKNTTLLYRIQNRALH